jgi:hypothetical protein
MGTLGTSGTTGISGNSGTMAEPKVKTRPPVQECRDATLRDTPDVSVLAPQNGKRPFMPWMEMADMWLERGGFVPGQRVTFTLDYRECRLMITPVYE